MDITMIIEAVFSLVATIAVTVIVPYIKSKTNAEQRENLSAWVKIAVEAAEQLYKGGGRGAEKKAYVIEWLKSHSITYDEGAIDAIIESAVFALKGGVV